MMYLRESKYLDVPTHTRRPINPSAFPSVSTLYVVLVWEVLLHLSFFSGFDLPKTSREKKKYLNMDTKRENPYTLPYFRGI